MSISQASHYSFLLAIMKVHLLIGKIIKSIRVYFFIFCSFPPASITEYSMSWLYDDAAELLQKWLTTPDAINTLKRLVLSPWTCR